MAIVLPSRNSGQVKNMNLVWNIDRLMCAIGKATAIPRWSFLITLLILGAAPRGSAQNGAVDNPLSLERAVAIALEKNPEAKAALADTKVARADAQAARSAFLPHVTFFETATRGNDPVYVFGSKLRQQRFSTQDFALNVLNRPPPFGNFSTKFGGNWTLFDSFASQHAVTRAGWMKKAADRQLEHTEQQIEYEVIDAYFGALQAKRRIAVMEQSLNTAQAISERSKNRYESGVIVESDYLSAQVRVKDRQRELIRARNDFSLARAKLSMALGLSTEGLFDPIDELAERALPQLKLEDLEKTAMESRADLRRLQSGEEIQRQNVAIAKSSFGPRINGFADWQLDNPTFLAGGGGNNWVAGIELQLDLFQGGAKRAQLAREKATLEKVSAMREAAKNAARLEVRREYYDMDAAARQLELAHLAIGDAKESLRVNQNRYEAGLSTITDLLAAEEASARTQNAYWEALCGYYRSYAATELASGTLTPHSPVVVP
jgi:outer membrane protein